LISAAARRFPSEVVDGAIGLTVRTWPTRTAKDQRKNEEHEEDHEQELGDTRCRDGDTAESEERRENSEDEKDNGPIKHTAIRHKRARCKTDPKNTGMTYRQAKVIVTRRPPRMGIA
jgi:hypothetical protein